MHRLLDQETADPDEPFKVQGYEIQYPGDPNAAPEMVYHCRCKLSPSLVRYPRQNAMRRDNVTGEVIQEQNYQEWLEGKKKQYNDLNLSAQPVTMQSISNVKAFSCETLGSAEQRQLQNAHKRLLVTALKQNENVEVGIVFDTHMKTLAKDLVGSLDGGAIDLPNPDIPYVAVHTHPDCSIFSPGDLQNFTERENLKLLTAIGHDGHVYAIEKSASYDSVTAKAISWKLSTEINRLKNLPQSELPNEQLLEQADALIRQSIAELENYGVKFYE